jgi:hypothetical protein
VGLVTSVRAFAVELLDELGECRLRHKSATTYLDAAQPSRRDEFERGGTSDAEAFHHLFDGVEPGVRPVYD